MIIENIYKLKENEIPLNIHIYLNENIESMSSIKLDNITSVSLFIKKNGMIFHIMLNKINSKYIVNESLSGYVASINSNHIEFLIKRIFPLNNIETKSVLALTSNLKLNITPKNKNQKWDDLSIRLYKMNKQLKKLNKNNTDLLNLGIGNDGENTQTCGEPCGFGEANQTCQSLHPTDPEECRNMYDDGCGCEDNRDVLLQNPGSMRSDSIINAHSTSLLYDYRDSILTKTYWGKKNITYYYYLSHF